MAEELKQEYTEADLQRIAQQVGGGTPTPSDQDVEGLTFDLNDDEIVKVTEIWCALMDKWFKRGFDLRTNMDFRNEVISRFQDIGFVVDVIWETRHPNPSETIMVPTISVRDRVGGLQVETDHDRKRWEANRNTLDELTPVPEVAKKLLD